MLGLYIDHERLRMASCNFDIVFCIDATASMAPKIDGIKKYILRFPKELASAMDARRRRINQLRIRLIGFRDFLTDHDDAILATGFFTLPQDTDLYERAVLSLTAFGGIGDRVDGLEALAYAMRSRWTPIAENTIRRQLIVVWTDSGTHEIGYGASASGYPVDKMAKSFEELSLWWPNKNQLPETLLDFCSSRLILFAPDEPYWSTIYNYWDNVVHFTSSAGCGLCVDNYNEILDQFVNSWETGY